MRRGQKSQASTEMDRLAEYLMVNFQSEIGKGNRREGESAVDVALRLLEKLREVFGEASGKGEYLECQKRYNARVVLALKLSAKKAIWDFLGMQPSSCERWTEYVEDFRNRDKPVRRGFGTKETEQ